MIVGRWWRLVVVLILGRGLIRGGSWRIITWGRLAIVGFILRLGVLRRRAVVDRWLIWGHIAACRLVLVGLAAHGWPEVVDDRVLPVVGRVPVVGIGSRIGGRIGDWLWLDDVLDVARVWRNLYPGYLHPWVPRWWTIDHWLALIINISPVKVRALEDFGNVIFCLKLNTTRRITWL